MLADGKLPASFDIYYTHTHTHNQHCIPSDAKPTTLVVFIPLYMYNIHLCGYPAPRW